MAELSTGPVLVARRGRLGLLTLNRPAVINALNETMSDLLAEALATWRDDDGVAVVAITGAGDRGLCAGGDIVSLAAAARAGDATVPARFWRSEYRLNATIARYPKPIVAVQDGIVLGGGIGISAHASHRVVTERSRLGMPETGIGFVPDVGGTWLLSHAHGQTGTRLALTADPVGPVEAIHAGLSDVLVRAERIPELLLALETDEADAVLARLREPTSPARVPDPAVDAAFAHDSVPAILAALRGLCSPEATAFADRIDARSPIACAVALTALRRARSLPSLEAAIETEYRVSLHAVLTHDFIEGVRAQLIDKDRSPAWDPATFDDVAAGDVEAYFAPRGEGGLGLATLPISGR